MNYFIYNGINSADMGVRISSKNIFSAPKYDLKFESIPGRDGDLISPNGRFPNTTISYTCFIPAKSIQELADKVTALKCWLYNEPDRYHTLSDSYDTSFFRKAVFNNKLDISDEINKIGVFTVNFTCHPMRFSYTGQAKSIYTASPFTLINPFPFEAKPYLKINGRGTGTVTIQSDSSTKVWNFTTLNGYTECDSELMNFYHDTELKNDTVSGEGFPSFVYGNNTIAFDGGITSIEVIPRWKSI